MSIFVTIAGYGAVSVTFNDAITTETTATIETTIQTVQQTTQKLTFGFGFKAGGGFSTTTTWDQKWTQSTKLTNTKTTITTVTPQVVAQAMCPTTAVDNTRESRPGIFPPGCPGDLRMTEWISGTPIHMLHIDG
jgi:hypothetical protein